VKILQVVTETDRRGAQVFVCDLGNALRARYDVTTVALAPGERSERLDVPTRGRRRRGARTLVELRRRMRSADVTVAHGSATLLECASLKWPHLGG
jgi:hypothetical protein